MPSAALSTTSPTTSPIDRSAWPELAGWRREIDALYAGAPRQRIARALVGGVQTFGLDRADFLAIIDGMEMDAEGPIVAPDRATLDLYCDRVASAVGRLCISIFGEPGANGKAVAHHLGRALQLANIARDVDEDARIGRVYLPRDLLHHHGIPATPPTGIMRHRAFPAAWRELAGPGARPIWRCRGSAGALPTGGRCGRHGS